MKSIIGLNLFLIIIFLIACGPGKEERLAIQKAREDSIRVAAENRIKKIQSLKDSLVNSQAQSEGLQNRIMIYKADLEAAKDKLNNSIKPYQLLRTPAEREEQVRNQTLLIQQIEKEINEMIARRDHLTVSIAEIQTELNNLK